MYITTTNQSLNIILEGGEQIAALKAKVMLPKKIIKSITWYEHFNDWCNWEVRIGGSYVPRWLMAGSYWTEQGWDFVYANKPKGMVKPRLDNVMVVETNQNRYHRVIITGTKKQTNQLLKWWKLKK
jgi:hypothetical protein